MGGFVSKVTDAVGLTNYGDQADAVKDATKAQVKGTQNQIAFLKESRDLARADLQPYAQFGQTQLGKYTALLDPKAQTEFLTSNPMFMAALQNTNRGIRNAGYMSGLKGDMQNQLFQNYMGQGNQFIDAQLNRMLQPIQTGQASAAGQAAGALSTGSQVGNAYSNLGDIRSAGIIGGQNVANQALAAGNQMLINGALMLSDRRMKKDIKLVGADDIGGIYEFRYIGGDGTRYIGRMADELMKTRPDAVKDVGGLMMVTSEFAPKRVA